jgi:uncharacterized protein (DUF305 family)
MAPVTRFGYRRSFVLIIATLIVPIMGGPAYSQHSHHASQPVSTDPAWAELQQSMQSMHEAMSSLESAGNDDADFVRLMLPHHQAAIDMAKVELSHGQDPQMRRLAQEIIADQESEIELMQLWLKQHRAQESQLTPSAAKEH